MSESTIAHLRQQIDATCEAMHRGFNGYAVTAKHAFISARFRQLEEQRGQLAQLVGDDEATTMICQAIDQASQSKAL